MRTGIACVVRNEEALIAEWIAFHALIGFDEIYVYDNRSTDTTVDIVHRIAKEVNVTLIDWPDTSGEFQNSAYTHASRRAAGKLDWIALIDVDEFIYSPLGISHKDILDNVPKCGALALNWSIYGSAGHEHVPSGTTVENYVFRASDNFGPNAHIKSIVRPSAGLVVQHCHRASDSLNFYDPDGVPIQWAGVGINNEPRPSKLLRLNHYFTRSKDDWKRKLRRGYRDIARDFGQFYLYDQNDVFDQGAALIGQEVRQKFSFVDPCPPSPFRLSEKSTIPLDFDADLYLTLHPDVARSQSDAQTHYLTHGRREGRRYKIDAVMPEAI